MQVKPTDLIYAVSLTDSMPSQNEAKIFIKVQLNFHNVKFNSLHNDIYYLVKIGNLSGGSGDKKTRSRGTLFTDKSKLHKKK